MNAKSLLFTGLLLVSGPVCLRAQTYFPNQFFGESNGIKILQQTNLIGTTHRLFLLPNDKFLAGVGGLDLNNEARLKTARFSSNCGGLDTTYGSRGYTFFKFNNRSYMNGMTLMNDLRVVGAGVDAPSNSGSAQIPMVCRITANGTPDTTFNHTGYWAGRFDARSSGSLHTAHVYPDRSILAIGESRGNINGGVSGVGLVRFLANGQLNTTFGTGGLTRVPMSFASNTRGVVLPNGAIVVTSNQVVGSVSHLRVLKFDSLGSLDTTFGIRGIISYNQQISTGERKSAYPILQGVNVIVVAPEQATSGSETVFMTRLRANGTVDPTFGAAGITRYVVPRDQGLELYGAELHADGKIYVPGKVGNDAAVARFTANGLIDAGFGTGGLVTFVDVAAGGERFTSVVPMPGDTAIYALASYGYAAVVKLTTRPNTKWVNLGADQTACAGTNIGLSAQNRGSSFLWNTGSIFQSIAPTTTGTYSVRVTDVAGCRQSDTVQVTFNPLPPVPAITRNVNTLSTTAIGTLQWFLNGNALSGANRPTFQVTANGNYTVQVTAAGCSTLSAPLSVVVSLKSALAAGITIAPNPARDMLQICWAEAGGAYNATLLNAAGQRIQAKLVKSESVWFETAHLPAGLYHVVLTTPSQRHVIGVVKE